ncbi:hypothetical protein [Cytobacillus gottheilii]|uniref:hypothetical protein n=1 Tax=Cytobacillus gottheilii TaxID=859144 RepID=UPI0024958599|nr:hypothetical protein [Cytobacillus gottheilii]
MRTWRVGTFSMGAALLLLGIYLLFSQLMGFNIEHIMISWWPIILVILGLEILLFLLFSRKEKPFLKYDFISIFFVGVLGMSGIGFALLSSSGVLQSVSAYMNSEEHTYDIKNMEQAIGEDVKRVVVSTGGNPISIEGTDINEVSMFGTVHSTLANSEMSKMDYVSMNEKGDTLYINIKRMPEYTNGPFNHHTSMDATLLVPVGLKLEVEADGSSVKVKPRLLKSDWTVDGSSDLNVMLEEASDVSLLADGVQDLGGNEQVWTISNREKADSYSEPAFDASFKTGEGSHTLQIVNGYRVSLHTMK